MMLENKHSVQSLPCEVLQKIFELLPASDLTAASLVSYYWRKVSERSIRKLCVLLIPGDILAEIISENKGCDWACIWYCWIKSKPGITNRFIKEVIYENLSSKDRVVCISPKGVFLGSRNGWLEKTGCSNLNQKCKVNINDGSVYSLTFMPYLNLLLAAGQRSLHFYKVESNRLVKVTSDFNLVLGENKDIRVFGPRFAARDELNGVHVLEIYYVGHAVRTTRLAVIHQNSDITQWQLWRDKLICILSSGDICVYCLYMNPVQEIYRSQCYTDILYKNPIWTFRDIVFVSSLESSVFDDKRETPSNAYSYMSDIWTERNGSGHWYIGSLDQESENGMFYGCQNLQIDTSTTSTASRASAMSSTASRASTMSYAATSVEEDWDNLQGYCLQRQYLGSSSSSDITCVFLSRSLLLCGTLDGRLLLFQVPTSNLDHSSTDFERLGGLCVWKWNMNVSHLSIQSVHLNFSGGYIEMYFMTPEELSCVKLQSGAIGYNAEPLIDILC